MVKFWDSHMHKIKPWYAKVQREDDIIVSGTTDFFAGRGDAPAGGQALCGLLY